MRACAPFAVVLGSIALAVGCLGAPRAVPAGEAADPLSPTLLPLVYQEDGAILFVGVDTRAAQYAKDPKSMFPLGLGLANRSHRALRFTRESFELETSSGQIYRIAGVLEFTERYKRSSSDRQLATPFLEKLGIKFARLPRSVSFFPASGSTGTVVDEFDLATTEWTHFYLYFPMPDDGLHGRRFKLLVRATGQPDPIVVAFEVR
jgi:hypothetical protein